MEKDSLLGKIDSLFLKFGEAKGVNCEECVELARIFSRAVDCNPTDFNRIRELESKSEVSSDETVWSRMKQRLEKWNLDISYKPTNFNDDRDISLISNQFKNTKIYDLNQFTQKYQSLSPPFYNIPLEFSNNQLVQFCTNKCRDLKCNRIHPDINQDQELENIKNLENLVCGEIWYCLQFFFI